MNTNPFQGVSLGLLVLLLPACAMDGRSMSQATVLIDEARLKRMVEVMPAEQGRTATGTLKVWTVIKNKSDKRLALEVRALFSGEKNEVIEPAPGWTRLFIDPHTSTTFEGLSMSDAAKKFVIEVREGNR